MFKHFEIDFPRLFYKKPLCFTLVRYIQLHATYTKGRHLHVFENERLLGKNTFRVNTD